jgi:glycerol-3-phosphate acyltransferase PlsX
MKIALDMMGGDFAPAEAALGVKKFLTEATTADLEIIGLGDKDKLTEAFHPFNQPLPPGLRMVHCTETIQYTEHPVKALKAKPDSEIAKGFALLASGEADAFISAGNTGAMMVGSMFYLKLSPGILRPTIATIIPRSNSKTGLLLDVGINSDCKPENLDQFATMGTVYARELLSIQNPTVGLLNIGEEEGKGNLLAQAAYPLLKQNPFIQFRGNVEGRDLLTDSVDVVVCDGFTGNVLLKLMESLYPVTRQQGISHSYFDRFHFEQYGGTPVLGIEKPVIVGHGVSGAEAFYNMIVLAEKMIRRDFIGKLAADFVQ